MKLFCCLAFVLALAVSSCAPPPRPASQGSGSSSSSQSAANPLSDNLAAVIAEIEGASDAVSSGDVSGVRNLPRHIDTLTRAIEGGQADAQGRIVLLYYRGAAFHLLAELNRMLGLPPDRKSAEAAISDFEAVARSATSDDEGYRETALYLAGGTASNTLNDPVRGMSYFERCAELGHGACQNMIASAMISGFGGQKKDIAGATELFLKAYETRLDYGCAGSYAAYSLARISHFNGAAPEGKTAFDWMRRAYRQADQIKTRSSGVDYCGGSFMSIYEYVMRLERKEKVPSLLEQAVPSADAADTPEVTSRMAEYLRGRALYGGYRQSVAGVRDVESRCQYAFIGLWYAAISNQTTGARSFREILQQDASNMDCAENLVFAGKYLR